MKYLFECSKCNNQEEKEISMADYDKEKENQVCEKCKGKMNRVIQFSGSVGLCSGMYGTGLNGWNN